MHAASREEEEVSSDRNRLERFRVQPGSQLLGARTESRRTPSCEAVHSRISATVCGTTAGLLENLLFRKLATFQKIFSILLKVISI
jgi:hypothetical protein